MLAAGNGGFAFEDGGQFGFGWPIAGYFYRSNGDGAGLAQHADRDYQACFGFHCVVIRENHQPVR